MLQDYVLIRVKTKVLCECEGLSQCTTSVESERKASLIQLSEKLIAGITVFH